MHFMSYFSHFRAHSFFSMSSGLSFFSVVSIYALFHIYICGISFHSILFTFIWWTSANAMSFTDQTANFICKYLQCLHFEFQVLNMLCQYPEIRSSGSSGRAENSTNNRATFNMCNVWFVITRACASNWFCMIFSFFKKKFPFIFDFDASLAVNFACRCR